jgi:protein ImuA
MRQASQRAATGLMALDARLPWGGLPYGGLHEVFGETSDAARFGFIATVLGRLSAHTGRILWCRSSAAVRESGGINTSGLAQFGLAPERVILVEARRPADALWAMEEGLRCRQLGAVIGEGLETSMLASRRLQLAAEAGEMLGLLLPLPGAVSPLSVALTRWRVTAAGSVGTEILGRARWLVSLLRCRGGGAGEWLVELDDETLRLLLVEDLGDRSLAAAQ